jgi:hypothetical protein
MTRIEEIKNRAEKWEVHGDSPERPPMIYDASGDAIVCQMPDGTPYFDPEIAEKIVSAVSKVEAAEKLAQAAESLLATTTPQDCTHGEEASYCLSCEFEAEKALGEAIDPAREALAAYRKTGE